jgi:phenylalanyl-tRNA synthetase beta chain
MIVSWKWLGDYVKLPDSTANTVNRLALSGLNHEQTVAVGDDFAVDLEVTSNRPDCLGHLGVAREIATLFKSEFHIPNVDPPVTAESILKQFQVHVEVPPLCPRYTARIVRGVKIGPSPAWLVGRLKTIGIQSINNVVDVTNYVMMECGQPLHAFDLRHLQGNRIIVRDAKPQEPFVAIDHRSYLLNPGMCVIADANRAVALGGVMGGSESEVSPETRDVLIEAADFAPLSIRATARKLSLFSPSSYRFERGVDRDAILWASLRCCQLILQVAGGSLLSDVIDVHQPPTSTRQPVTLRWAQISRVLGIPIAPSIATDILMSLGMKKISETTDAITVTIPAWRRDLTREIDLIEELARIHGYEAIPENVAVPMAASHRRKEDRVTSKVRETLSACGLHEALTASVVTATWSTALSPWSNEAPLRTGTPMLRGADHLRRSLIPSLLGALRENEKNGVKHNGLFELAKIYLPRPGEPDGLPIEPLMLSIATPIDMEKLKGIIETFLERIGISQPLVYQSAQVAGCSENQTARLLLGPSNRCVGILATIHDRTRQLFDLQSNYSVAELELDSLIDLAVLVPHYRPLPNYPAVERELNLVVAESLTWSQLSNTVVASAGEILENLRYLETYRDAKRDGADKKRLLFSMTFRAPDRTLDGDEVNSACHRVIAACETSHQAKLL